MEGYVMGVPPFWRQPFFRIIGCGMGNGDLFVQNSKENTKGL